MKKVLFILSLLLLANQVNAACNYSYKTIEPEASNNKVEIVESGENTAKIKLNGGFNSNRGYIKIKVNNGRAIRLNTPKLSNNSILKLVNITF